MKTVCEVRSKIRIECFIIIITVGLIIKMMCSLPSSFNFPSNGHQSLFKSTAARAEVCSGTGERFRIFRAEKTYAVKAGRWYFEFEAVTAGDMRVGWSRPGCQPDQELGSDECAFAFDGFKVSGLCCAPDTEVCRLLVL